MEAEPAARDICEVDLNGVALLLKPRQYAMFDLLIAAGDGVCVSGDSLKAAHGGSDGAFFDDLRAMRALFAECAGYTIAGVRGEGYHLSPLGAA